MSEKGEKRHVGPGKERTTVYCLQRSLADKAARMMGLECMEEARFAASTYHGHGQNSLEEMEIALKAH